MAKEEKEKKAPTKRPSALKRDIQNEKRQLINKSFKSKVRTTLRSFEESLKSKDEGKIQTALKEIYSISDKGVKKGALNPNKANRLKERAQAKAQANA